MIEIKLKYDANGAGALHGVKFVSKPSLRRYIGYRDVKLVKQGYGIAVLSTPQGILASKEARSQKLGGELLFEVW